MINLKNCVYCWRATTSFAVAPKLERICINRLKISVDLSFLIPKTELYVSIFSNLLVSTSFILSERPICEPLSKVPGLPSDFGSFFTINVKASRIILISEQGNSFERLVKSKISKRQSFFAICI